MVVAGGRVERLLASRAELGRAARDHPVTDLGDVVLTPGLVNAHAHLELSGLAGRLPRGPDFRAWIGRLLELRAEHGPERLARAARAGADRCLATGTTAGGDVDSTGAAIVGLADHPIRVVHYREVLDAHDPARTAPALARLERALPGAPGRREGISPHAPFSASAALLAGVARLARERSAPVSVHWSETVSETEWLERGEGPLAGLLGPSPLRPGLDLIAEAGLLGPGLSLVHGNHPRPDEPARIALAGATVVHCPGSHAWFERAPAPLELYVRSGVRLALGTDSLASNEDLDLRAEMARARKAAPWLAPADVWAMATRGGAAALGAGGELGVLAPGARADLLAHRAAPGGREQTLDELTSARVEILGTWIAGRPVGTA